MDFLKQSGFLFKNHTPKNQTPFEKLFDVFKELITYTSGDFEEAIDLEKIANHRGSAFGKKVSELGANYDIIANSRIEIEMARLLCLKAAWMMDNFDPKTAAPWISKIKVIAPQVALKVVDEAIQLYGGMGVSQDTPLAAAWTHLRTLRLADGPDAVHRRQVAKAELKKFNKNDF